MNNSISLTSQKEINANAGRMLWLSLTHSIILTEQMRQKDDIVFAEFLSNLRTGNVTDEQYNLLKSRIMNETNYNNDFENATYIVARNAIREEINRYKIKQYAAKYSKQMFVCNGVDQQVQSENVKNPLLSLLLKLKLVLAVD